MTLRLIREPSKDGATMGSIYVDGYWVCWSLEDPIRDVKVPGDTAIPAGRYRVEVTMSPRFKRRLPLLIDVPNFTGVRIHAGNRSSDTEGCILPGRTRGTGMVMESRMAFEHLFALIETAAPEPVWIEIENPRA
jgi:hypothetical protein